MINLQDLIDRFGETELCELSDRQNFSVINETVIDRAIADATADVESYLNATGLFERNNEGDLIYTFSENVPKSLIIRICDIARYYLHDDVVTEIVEKRYNQSIDWLKMVAKNPAMLTGETNLNANHGVNSGIAVMPNPTPDMWKMS